MAQPTLRILARPRDGAGLPIGLAALPPACVRSRHSWREVGDDHGCRLGGSPAVWSVFSCRHCGSEKLQARVLPGWEGVGRSSSLRRYLEGDA